MHNKRRGLGSESFVIQVWGSGTGATELVLDQHHQPQPQPQAKIPFPKLNFSAMKLFQRFRKILMRLVFSVPSRGSSSDSRHRNSDRFEPPKTSCSSYYSSYSHYNEAIADCIEFFNNSAQDGILDARKSDVV